MGLRGAPLFGLVLLVMPAFSDDGPKPTDQPEFYFTRLMYTDVYGRGPSGAGLARFRGFGRGAWMTDAWDADNKYM